MASATWLAKALPAGTTILVLGIWEVASRLGALPDAVPPVTSIVGSLIDQLTDSELFVSLWETIKQFIVGLLLGSAIGIGAGVALGLVPILYRISHVTVDFLRFIPAIVYLPVLLLVMGATPTASVLLGAIGAVWSLLFQAYYGVSGVDSVMTETGRVYGLTFLQRLGHITLPAVSPFIATGLRIAASHVLVVVVAVEIIAGVPGIGSKIEEYASNAVYPEMYALIFVVGLLGVAVNAGLYRLERGQLRWHSAHRKG